MLWKPEKDFLAENDELLADISLIFFYTSPHSIKVSLLEMVRFPLTIHHLFLYIPERHKINNLPKMIKLDTVHSSEATSYVLLVMKNLKP